MDYIYTSVLRALVLSLVATCTDRRGVGKWSRVESMMMAYGENFVRKFRHKNLRGEDLRKIGGVEKRFVKRLAYLLDFIPVIQTKWFFYSSKWENKMIMIILKDFSIENVGGN